MKVVYVVRCCTDGRCLGYRLLKQACVLLLAVLAASGCAEPSGSYGDYRAKIHRTATEMVSAIATAELGARQLMAGHATRPYADVVVSDAEKDGDSAQTAFDSRQPPDERSITLRNNVDQTLQQAVSGLADLRIAVRRDSVAGMRKALGELAKPLRQLQGRSS